MSHNTFGHLFRVTTFGESHGPIIGCVVDGCPPKIPLNAAYIQSFLDKRRPGRSPHTSLRQEEDKIQILSGTFWDPDQKTEVTTGTPILLMIENKDSRSADYESIREVYRPGHADFTYMAKYGIRDYRGGGRASARETAMRVAAGAVARKIIPAVRIQGALIQMGPHKINEAHWNWEEVDRNPFFCPDAEAAYFYENYLTQIREKGSSTGAVLFLRAQNVPPGWGAPLYGKLDADLASTLMSINAVKGVEIGAGFAAASAEAPEQTDIMKLNEAGEIIFSSNHAGGIIAGISTGQDILVRFAVKPTSSIPRSLPTLTQNHQETEIRVLGRHDPCVGIRAVPVGEAMMACTLADHYLRHRAQVGI